MDVEELPSDVRQASGFRHALLIKARIVGVAVRLQDAFEPRQACFRMLIFAIRTVTIQHRPRGFAGERVIVTDIAPDPFGPGVLPFPGASTGTVVSLACTRTAAITYAPTASTSGRNSLAHCPTQSAKVQSKFSNVDGAISVLTIKPTMPANGQRAGHYAFAAFNAAGQQNTIGILESRVMDITSTSMDSSIALQYMDNVNTQPSGTYAYQQPNKSVLISSAGLNLPDIPITNTSNILTVLSGPAFNAGGREVLRLSASYDGGTVGSGGFLAFYGTGTTIFGTVRSLVEANNQIGMSFSTCNSGLGERVRISAAGNVGIGIATPLGKVHVSAPSVETAVDAFGLYVSGAQSVGNSGGHHGFYVNPTFTAASGNTLTALRGILCVPRNTNAGDVTAMYGVIGQPENTNSGTVSLMYGQAGTPRNTGSGTVTAMAGLYSRCDYTNAGGTVSTCYGLYIDAPTATGAITVKYGVFQADDASQDYYAGSVGIGNTTPTHKLDVSGTLAVTGEVVMTGLATTCSGRPIGTIAVISTVFTLCPQGIP